MILDLPGFLNPISVGARSCVGSGATLKPNSPSSTLWGRIGLSEGRRAGVPFFCAAGNLERLGKRDRYNVMRTAG